MSQEKAEIAHSNVVRQPIRVRASNHRRPEERLFLRFPWLVPPVSRLLFALAPRSRLRKAGIRRLSRLALEGANRGDYAAVFATLPDHFEVVTPRELVQVGFEPRYRGREGRMRMQQTWVAELGEFHQEGKEVIDAGDRLVLLARMRGTGASSGAAFDSEIAYLLTVFGGRIVREQSFRDHREALKAAGLSE
jgi:ketosteroid isomerase-like protein